LAGNATLPYTPSTAAKTPAPGPRVHIPLKVGNLFHAGCDELRQVSFAEALALLLNSLETFDDEVAQPTTEALAEFMIQIPGFLRRSMLLPACIF
jgi:hypothetical protein